MWKGGQADGIDASTIIKHPSLDRPLPPVLERSARRCAGGASRSAVAVTGPKGQAHGLLGFSRGTSAASRAFAPRKSALVRITDGVAPSVLLTPTVLREWVPLAINKVRRVPSWRN